MTRTPRAAFTLSVWMRLDVCPTCNAKTNERCMRQDKVVPQPCTTPHKDRPYLPQYQRGKRT